MEISVSKANKVTVVAISGSVDGLTAADLQAALGAQIQDGNIHLVADFANVEYTSSAGLRALLGTTKDARRVGGDFRLAAVRPDVHRVLELSGFTSILKLFNDVDSAVASYGN